MAAKPWMEKYRPKSLDEVVHQKSALRLLEAALANQSLPHMLFAGPPGTGKTTVALVVGRRLFGSSFKERVMELNASDDRGVDVVRDTIKNRASRQCSATEDIPDFQLIILDEADCMTSDAQQALLRTMEVYARNTRFIITCNYISRIIAPLVSRCATIRFQSIPEAAMKDHINAICHQEDVLLEEEAFHGLAKAANGDLRRAVVLLQSAVGLGGKPVSLATVLDVSGHVPDSLIKDFEAMSIEGPASSFVAVQNAIHAGYSAKQILLQFTERLLANPDYTDLQKAKIFEVIADVDHKLSVGADETLQLLRVGSIIGKAADGYEAMTVPSPTDLVQPPSGPSQPDDDALVPASVMPYLNFDGAVHYLSDGNDIDSWCVQIPRGAVLGFDTESHTTFDGRQHGVALVQFCFERDEEFICLLIHVHISGMTRELATVLGDPGIKKVGVNAECDAKRLARDFKVDVNGIIDLQELVQHKDLSLIDSSYLYTSSEESLQGLTQRLWCRRLRKKKRAGGGNWRAQPLTDAQIKYAAADAFASLLCYNALDML